MMVLLRDKRTGTEQWVPLDDAAEAMNLDPNEIEWALDEFGECESDNHIAIDYQ